MIVAYSSVLPLGASRGRGREMNREVEWMNLGDEFNVGHVEME